MSITFFGMGAKLRFTLFLYGVYGHLLRRILTFNIRNVVFSVIFVSPCRKIACFFVIDRPAIIYLRIETNSQIWLGFCGFY